MILTGHPRTPYMKTPLRAIPSMPGTELHLPSTPLRSDSNRGSCPTTPDLMNLVQVRGTRTWSIELHIWFGLFGNPWSRSTLLQETNSLKYTTNLKGFGSLFFSLFYPRYEGVSRIVPPYIFICKRSEVQIPPQHWLNLIS